jgi:hypothetical protein
MNYQEQYKKLETQVSTVNAQAIAKLQTVKDELERKKKAEDEIKKTLGISLSEVASEIEKADQEIQDLCQSVEDILKEIKDDISTIKQ